MIKRKETLEETVVRLKREAASMKVAILFLGTVMVTKDLVALFMFYFG